MGISKCQISKAEKSLSNSVTLIPSNQVQAALIIRRLGIWGFDFLRLTTYLTPKFAIRDIFPPLVTAFRQFSD